MCAGREGGSPRICHGALFPLGASLQGRVGVGDTPPTQSSPLPPRAPSRLLLLPTDRNRPRPLGARPPQPGLPSPAAPVVQVPPTALTPTGLGARRPSAHARITPHARAASRPLPSGHAPTARPSAQGGLGRRCPAWEGREGASGHRGRALPCPGSRGRLSRLWSRPGHGTAGARRPARAVASSGRSSVRRAAGLVGVSVRSGLREELSA